MAKGNRTPRTQVIREGLKIHGKKLPNGCYRYSVDYRGVTSSGTAKMRNLHYYMDSLERDYAEKPLTP
jgi:hypothetical protein